MNLANPYIKIILISVIIILSYLFNQVSKKTNIPSVLLLIILGVVFGESLKYFQVNTGIAWLQVLEILGIVGLIMIVLEAALDLKLSKDKASLITKSFFVALLALLVSAGGIAYLLHYFFIDNFFISLVYATPLAIMSSAIIIPSVSGLVKSKKEFLIYEATFSDILGIMLFYFLLGSSETATTQTIVFDVTSNIFLTILLSFIVSYALVLLFQKLDSQVKLFLLIAVLILLYSVGKLFHLSSLLIILVFGLVLNNHQLFFRGSLRNLIDSKALNHVVEDFHVVTMESAFVVRTFFFVIFGMTLELNTLLDLRTALTAIAIVGILYLVRFIFLQLFIGKKGILPELFVAPRGLITILLFFAIPLQYQVETFNKGILLYVILITSVIMTLGLIAKGKETEKVESLAFTDWEELDKEINSLYRKE